VVSASTFTYNICSNGAAGDWYWEVTNRGKIIARGLAATEVFARAAGPLADSGHPARTPA
jgi:hypothetical protein